MRIAPGWYDITHDLEPGSPPTLARDDGTGVLQFSTAIYRAGRKPSIGVVELSEMLASFARAHGFEPPTNIVIKERDLSIVSGDCANDGEIIRVWYVAGSEKVAFITYVSQEPANPKTLEELQIAGGMVVSICG